MKKFRRTLLALVVLIFVIFLGELFFMLVSKSYSVANLRSTHRCAWIDKAPVDWYCFDDWASPTRHILVVNKDQSLSLYISTNRNMLPDGCKKVFPLGIPRIVSASGLTIPFWCIDGFKIKQVSDWEQDGWYFRLMGINVPRDLFMENLRTVGYAE